MSVVAASLKKKTTYRMKLATTAETAALAGLPAEPSAYGIPAAESRRIPASRDIFTPAVFFFFQAEDGIRGRTVTGVQTCALPICPHRAPLGLARVEKPAPSGVAA